jgi:hypothetical protein
MKTVDPGTVEELFRLARAAETELKVFYRGLRAIFARDPAAAAFWGRMYEDETEHCRELLLIHHALPPDVRRSPADPEIVAAARRNLRMPLREKFRAIRNLDDAYTVAHDMENSEVMTVFSFIREKFVPLVRRRAFSLSVLEEHLGRIMDFPRRFGDASARLRVFARRKQ